MPTVQTASQLTARNVRKPQRIATHRTPNIIVVSTNEFSSDKSRKEVGFLRGGALCVCVCTHLQVVAHFVRTAPREDERRRRRRHRRLHKTTNTTLHAYESACTPNTRKVHGEKMYIYEIYMCVFVCVVLCCANTHAWCRISYLPARCALRCLLYSNRVCTTTTTATTTVVVVVIVVVVVSTTSSHA